MTDAEPTWITCENAVAFHDVLLDLYGGAAGGRDVGLVDSALARPQNVYHHETRDRVVLAATYAHGLARNHGFVDGNKRTALVCALTFLRINGAPFRGDQAEAVVMVEGLASGKVDRDTFAGWLRKMTS